MSCECKSISCLFQVFISPSLHLSPRLLFSLYPLPLWRSFSSLFTCAHTAPFYSATIVLFSSLLIWQSVILLLFVKTLYPFIQYQRQRCPNLSAAGKEDSVHENECHSGTVWRYNWSSCQSPVAQNKFSRPSAQWGSRPDNSLLTWRTFICRWVLDRRVSIESFHNKSLLF